MTAKTMRVPLAMNDVGAVFANLLVTRPGAPKDAAKIFTEALDLHIREFVEERLQAKASEILAHERATPAWAAEREPGGGVAQAVADGARFKHETLTRPEMLSSTAGAKLASISRQALDDRRKNGHALGLSAVKRGYRYPAWQFEDEVAASLPEILEALASRDAWGQYLFFVQAEPLLGGETPLAALRAGKKADVVRVAKLLAEEG